MRGACTHYADEYEEEDVGCNEDFVGGPVLSPSEEDARALIGDH